MTIPSVTLWLILSILACYRLSQLIACDDGPLGIFSVIRDAAKASRFPTLSKLLHCPYCMGVWIALVLAVLVMWKAPLCTFVIYALAVAGGQAVLESLAPCGEEENEHVESK